MSDNESYISVNEFSQLVGLSRQTVYRRMRQDLSHFVKVVNGKKTISEQALQLFGGNDSVTQSVTHGVTPELQEVLKAQVTMVTELSHQVDILTRQLETKDKQLDTKDKQIEELNARLAEAQSMAQSVAQANAVLASQAQQLQAIETQERQQERRRRWFRRS